MIRRNLWIAVLLLAAGCHPSRTECEKLLDHFVNVVASEQTSQLRGMTPAMMQALERETQQFREANGREFVEQCTTTLRPSQVACALTAADSEGMDRCE